MADDNTDVFIYTGEVEVPDDDDDYEGVVVPEDVVRVRVHPSVTVIPGRAFYKQQKLKEVELCEGLLEIEGQAFFGCYSLKNIKIPSTVIAIDTQALWECTSLKNIIIPTGVKRIGAQAFAHMQTNIQLPNSIESIGRYAFACNENITKFRMPPLIASTSVGMFSACYGIFSIEILESVTEIEMLSFSACILYGMWLYRRLQELVGMLLGMFIFDIVEISNNCLTQRLHVHVKLSMH